MPEQPGPGLSAWLAVGVAVVAEQLELHHTARRGRDVGMGHDLAPSFGVRAEYAVLAHHVQPRWRHEGANASDEIERLEQERDGAIFPRLLEEVAKLAARLLFEAVLRDRRPANVATQPLELGAITRRDGDLGVHGSDGSSG